VDDVAVPTARPFQGSGTIGIIAGPDGKPWFTFPGQIPGQSPAVVGRIDAQGPVVFSVDLTYVGGMTSALGATFG